MQAIFLNNDGTVRIESAQGWHNKIGQMHKKMKLTLLPSSSIFGSPEKWQESQPYEVILYKCIAKTDAFWIYEEID